MRPHPPPDETPTLPSPLLTLPHPCLIFSLAYNPYAAVGPSSYASDAAYHPYACGVPFQHASNTAYHPYAHIVPTQYASNAAYHPYAHSALPTCLRCSLPSLPLWSALLTFL
ncbi:hypothetical protein O181_092882 [Austropuccinia psidii MF-1]|uniref:Uncharacterized protein n=1 Tax=Austropuccinia psidii MF-1 TaxID=1389203 RepID=A0A9Q3J003_9BASI|nr:hypothetical protein [Austropuccinia psidii MF-1]